MGELTGQLAKLQFGGTLPGGEIWNSNIFLATQGSEVFDSPGDLTLLLPPLRDWFGRSTSMIQPTAVLTFVKLNQINKATGKYANAGDSVGVLLVPPQASGGVGEQVPQQLTAALTWHTDIARGRASHGRIYPPSTFNLGGGSTLGADGRMTTQAAKGMADSGQELLAEINNATVNLTACVWSQVGQVARAIERVSCGRIVDDQRRRRNHLLEDRQFATAAV